jgi:RNA polymerase sigma factor (sigma-70 family)
MERKQVRERFLRLLSEEATEPTITNSEQLRMTELMQYVEEHLPPLSQQIFRLRYLREMTCQEVADALGISRMTVHSHLKESVEQIRVYFKSIQ